MHDLNKYIKECTGELDRLHIPYAKNIQFVINHRACLRQGQCCRQGGNYTIEISAALLDDRVDVKEGLKNTLHHALLHSCCGCMKHTGRWKAYADRVNAAYGYNIRRCASKDDQPLPRDLLPKAKYLLRCSKCGAEYPRQKMSAVVQHPERYRCGKCGGTLINATEKAE